MRANFFVYKDACPTCAELGKIDPLTGEIVRLGFDIDTTTICCQEGHTFAEMPGALRTDETPVATLSDASLRNEATIAADSTPAVEGGEPPSLETEKEQVNYVIPAEDSQALAQLAEKLNEVPAEVSMPVVETGSDPVVAQGARLTNGDVVFAITVPERWIEAVKAEAEIQNQSASDYLQQWFVEALENFWVSNYTQSR